MNEIIKVDPKEFGLEQSKAKQIEQSFTPMLKQMTELEKEFNEVIGKPVSIEVCKEARAIRLKYVKVRTGTAAIHKELKAFYLAAGRFIDGWKNTQLFAAQGNEEKLSEIENHFENIRKAEIVKLQQDRETELKQYEVAIPGNLGEMEPKVYEAYLAGVILIHNNKIEAERKKKEEEQKAIKMKELYYQRERELLPFSNFIDWDKFTEATTDKEYSVILKGGKDAKKADEEKQELIRKENERLQRETEKKEAEIQKIADKAAKEKLIREEKERKDIERHAYELELERKRVDKIAGDKLESDKKAEDLKRQLQEAEKKSILHDVPNYKGESTNSGLIGRERTDLEFYANDLTELQVPRMESEKGKEIIKNAIGAIQKVSEYIIKQSENL